jgi:hypothetical protein
VHGDAPHVFSLELDLSCVASGTDLKPERPDRRPRWPLRIELPARSHRRLCKQEVGGSSRLVSTKERAIDGPSSPEALSRSSRIDR